MSRTKNLTNNFLISIFVGTTNFLIENVESEKSTILANCFFMWLMKFKISTIKPLNSMSKFISSLTMQYVSQAVSYRPSIPFYEVK